MASWIFGMLINIIGFIPVLIYSYIYTEFFTKYTLAYSGILIDWSEKETKIIAIFIRSWILELPLEEHSKPLFLFSQRREYLVLITIHSMFLLARDCSRSMIMLRLGRWTTMTLKNNSRRLCLILSSSVHRLWYFQIRLKRCKLLKVFNF